MSVSTLFDGAMAKVIDGSPACWSRATVRPQQIAPPRTRIKGTLAALVACGAP